MESNNINGASCNGSYDSESSSSSSSGTDDSDDYEGRKEGKKFEISRISGSQIEQIGDRFSIKELNVSLTGTPALIRKSSSKIIVNVEENFSQAQDYLINRYLKQFSKLTPISWCPGFRQDMSKVYTNLHIRATNKKFKFADDSKLPLQEIFKQCAKVAPDDPISIFIEGASGFGKTTVASKIAYDWATMYKTDDSSNYLKDFSMVIVIVLRKFQGTNIADYLCSEVFPDLFSSRKRRQSLMTKLEEQKEKILFILDGYDELLGGENKELLLKILDRKFLSSCSIILTSQPNRVDEVLEYCNLRLKITGFEYEQAKEYIVKYCSENNADYDFLLKEMTSEKNIYRQLSACPLLLLLLCVLAEENGGNGSKLPTKVAHVVRDISTCVIRRNMAKHGKQVENPFIYFGSLLAKLGSICLKALIDKRGYLIRSDLQLDMEEDVVKLGLFSRPSSSSVMHTVNVFEPLHVIFMEFLAAYYMATIIDDKTNIVIESQIESLRSTPQSFSYILIFLSGLLAKKAFKLFQILPQDIFLANQSMTMKLLLESGELAENILRLLPQHDANVSNNEILLSGWAQVLSYSHCEIVNVNLILDLDKHLHEKYMAISEAIRHNGIIKSLSMILNCDHAMGINESSCIATYIEAVADSVSISDFAIDINYIETVDSSRYAPIIEALCSFIKKSESLKQISIDIELSCEQINKIKSAILLSKNVSNISFPFLCCSKTSMINLFEILYSSSLQISVLNLSNYHERIDGLSIHRSLSLNSNESDDDSNKNSCLNHDTAIHHLMQAVSYSKCLKVLNLSRSPCCLSDYQCISRSVASSVYITTLVIHGISSFAHVRPILHLVTTKNNLRHLDLTSDKITFDDSNIEEFYELLSKHNDYLLLQTLILAKWKCILRKRKSALILYRILKYFKYLRQLDLSSTMTKVYFYLETGIYEQLKKARLQRVAQANLNIDHMTVVLDRQNNTTAHVAQCFSLIFFFPSFDINCCCLDAQRPVNNSEFRRVFKTVSKIPHLRSMTMRNWNVCLREPDKLFDCICKYSKSSSLRSIDISNLNIYNDEGQSLFISFFRWLLSSMRSLNHITLSVNMLTEEMSNQMVEAIIEHIWGKNLTVSLSDVNVHNPLDESLDQTSTANELISFDGRAQNFIQALNSRSLILTKYDRYLSKVEIYVIFSKIRSVKRMIGNFFSG